MNAIQFCPCANTVYLSKMFIDICVSMYHGKQLPCIDFTVMWSINEGTAWDLKTAAAGFLSGGCPARLRRLKDISTLDFSTLSFNPRLQTFQPWTFQSQTFQPWISNHGVEKVRVEKSGVETSFKSYREMTWLFIPMVQKSNFEKSEVEKSAVEKSEVEKSGVERSGVEMFFNS